MRNPATPTLAALLTALFAVTAPTRQAQAADANQEIIREVMKTCHKAPQGQDPISKKAMDGKATAEEIRKLVGYYQKLARTTPPKGDAASWKEKTTKLLAAAEALVKNAPDARTKYKEAANCKACHDAHKPE